MNSQVPESESRWAARVGVDFTLRTMRLLTELVGGDAVDALLTLTVLQINTAHAVRGESARRTEPPPDDERRPISVLSLSQALGMPSETVRRRVDGLVRRGWLERVKGGVIVPSTAVVLGNVDRALDANWNNLRRLSRQLEERRLFQEDSEGVAAPASQ